MDIQQQLEVIKESERLEQIRKFATICDSCKFEFVPMTHYVKDGNKFCECGDCGEVMLLSS